jgi:hypothetical protein
MNSCIVYNMFIKHIYILEFIRELINENRRPTYDIRPEHVDHSKTIREFINVFET